MRSAFLVGLSALSLIACQRQEEAKAPAAETPPPVEVQAPPLEQAAAPDPVPTMEARMADAKEMPPKPPAQCTPGKPGQAVLVMAGAAADDFTIELKCGGQVVTSCQATPPVMNGKCVAPAKPQVAGAADCVVTPKQGPPPNTPAARVVLSGCVI